MPIENALVPPESGVPIPLSIPLDSARDFNDQDRAPDYNLRCNTLIIIENQIDGVQIAFNKGMLSNPIEVDLHPHDNVVIFKGKVEGLWISNPASAGKTLEILYGNDIVWTHAHKSVLYETDSETESNANIANGANYTSTWFDVQYMGFVYMLVTVFADKALTIDVEQSHDANTVIRKDSVAYTASTTTGNVNKAQIVARYVRIKVSNDSGSNTTTCIIARRWANA
jgi:hypothetical protein